jgi:hypothetical protein
MRPSNVDKQEIKHTNPSSLASPHAFSSRWQAREAKCGVLSFEEKNKGRCRN